MRLHTLFLTVLFASFSATAASFVGTPAITDQGSQVKITFEVDRYTDVSVFIEDHTRKIVRHLASGKLGPNPPLPFTPNSRSQTLYWDKRSDKGVGIDATCKVKIGLDMQANFDRIYGQNSQNDIQHTGGSAAALAVDASGDLIVRVSGGKGNPRILAFNSNGLYDRTLAPYPGYLEESKLTGFGRIDDGYGGKMPVVYESRHGVVTPASFTDHDFQMIVTSRGWLVMVNDRNNFYEGPDHPARRLFIMAVDGSCPRDSMYGPILSAPSVNGKVYLAASPDGNTVYACGLGQHAILSSPVDFDGLMTVLAGERTAAGNDNTHFYQPHGLATDASGRLYVCDYGNNRIMVLGPNGAYLSQKAVRRPDKIQINPSTGELYVTSIDSAVAFVDLVKFSAYPGLDSLYRLREAMTQAVAEDRRWPLLALDAVSSPVKLWYGPLVDRKDAQKLFLAHDNGSAITKQTVTIGSWTTHTLEQTYGMNTFESPGYMAVDPREQFLYAGVGKWVRIDLNTGALTTSAIQANDLVIGPDRNIYGYGRGESGSYHDSSMRKYDLAEKALTWDGTKTVFYTAKNKFDGPHIGSHGFTVLDDGSMVIGHASEPDPKICTYNPNGTIKDTLVVCYSGGNKKLGSVQLDPAGNIFFAFGTRPKGINYPSVFTGKYFPNILNSGINWDYALFNHYGFGIGSILKFPPSGGTLRNFSGSGLVSVADVPMADLSHDTVPVRQVEGLGKWAYEIRGAIGQYFGIAPSSSHSGGHRFCQCISPRFTVDKFGNVIAPEAMRFSVVILDNNMNEMLRFGKYGNPDQQGPGSAHPVPEIPLAFPSYVQKVNNHVYISDVANHRITRVLLSYGTLFNGDSIVIKPADQEEAVASAASEVTVYPTPFNPSVHFTVTLPKNQNVEISIFNTQGKLVRKIVKKQMGIGAHALVWDGKNRSGESMGAGVYMAHINLDGRRIIKKLTMIR